MQTVKHEEVLYIIEVHGFAPEFFPAVAYRRNGPKKPKVPERQKEIKCPYCGKLFMVVSVERRLDLVRFTHRVKMKCHEYRKCVKCRESIGIVYLAGESA
jgi:ssDNA-binding Zn-finger/Zn-ribbon topoisomerase 1